ncbi:MAG: prephenate dehydrogenase/arogenate dehydrogenase family protein [Pelagibacteraceae bacterium]
MKNISIIGIGLIGSSIARSIKSIFPELNIEIIDHSKNHLEKSKELNLGNEYKLSIDNNISKSDVVFVCAPLSSYEEIFANIQNHLANEKTIITDVGSSKLKIIELAQKKLKNIKFVPGHPIAGTEHSGPQSGFKDLFLNKWFISTPCNLCSDKELNVINDLWKKMGSKIEVMDAKNHDSIMAITSHIPHLIAYNIVGTANDLGDSIKSEVIKFSASGFKDFTRIASSDPTMWRDIMLSNKDEILSLLNKFNDDLKGLIEAIKGGDGDYLFERFKKTKNIRQKILEEDKNKS